MQLTEINNDNVQTDTPAKEVNNLFPVFLKLEQLRLLIVGGGYVGMEKLGAVLSNSPATKIRLVATEISYEIKEIAATNANMQLIEKPFSEDDLQDIDVVITAINDREISSAIAGVVKAKGILVNVADKPELCDFYLGSVVKKGNLKIAISTNGKSPTVAKRLKEQLNELIPDEIERVLDNMQSIRKNLKVDFANKVRKLDEVTSVLAAKEKLPEAGRLEEVTPVLAAKQETLEVDLKSGGPGWMKIVKFCLLAFFFMILGHAILSYIPLHQLVDGIQSVPQYIDTPTFLLMLLTGFLAQMVDGSLGMGYGTISTTFLLAQGVNPAIVSSRVHAARVFSSGVSGYSHHRFGNINKKLFKTLVIPGMIGAVIGASLSYYGQKYGSYIRIPLSIYTFYLGFFIMKKAFQKKNHQEKVKRAGWLATAGGFFDAFAGGGWGTLVTSTLMSKRRSARYVIGSVCLAEFFVVFTSSITFFILLKSIPLLDVAGLVVGGLIAAPIAARLVGKLPLKTMFILVGTFVILASLHTLWKVIGQL